MSFEKALLFVRDLLVDFPPLDLEKEIKNRKTWLLDKKLRVKIIMLEITCFEFCLIY